jgi:hypothetical protein
MVKGGQRVESHSRHDWASQNRQWNEDFYSGILCSCFSSSLKKWMSPIEMNEWLTWKFFLISHLRSSPYLSWVRSTLMIQSCSHAQQQQQFKNTFNPDTAWQQRNQMGRFLVVSRLYLYIAFAFLLTIAPYMAHEKELVNYSAIDSTTWIIE